MATGEVATSIQPVSVERTDVRDALDVVAERAAVAAAAYAGSVLGREDLRGFTPPSTCRSTRRRRSLP